MAYWRMQLHPTDPSQALKHTVACLASAYIGLDFGSGRGPTPRSDDVGDLVHVDPEKLPANQRFYQDFATQMKVDDRVLIIVHNFPFALCRVAGDYNYVRDVPAELPIWFRHFRRVDEVWYYGDLRKDPGAWEKNVMVSAIGRLRDEDKPSYALIREWIAAAQR
jgi:hypothetical protein